MILSGVLAAGTAATGTARPADPPDTELLEFLGGYETTGGKWIDPTTLNGDTGKPAPTSTAAPAPPPKEKSP